MNSMTFVKLDYKPLALCVAAQEERIWNLNEKRKVFHLA